MRFSAKRHTVITTGNIIAARMPAFISPPALSETNPTRVGPPEQPTSPASARSANIAVPPPFIEAEALLNVPGHIMPTEKPHTAQPIRDTTGFGTRVMHRYAPMHRKQLYFINLSRSSL